MLARLGNVLYWICSAIAVVFVVLAVLSFESIEVNRGASYLSLLIAAVAYGLGAAIRYVLGGGRPEY